MNLQYLSKAASLILMTILLLLMGCEQAKNVKIIAHRGGTTERPENTLTAFKIARAQGADMLELDVRTSKDGKLFVLHDATLDRTTSGSGPAANLRMAELKELDAGSWFDPAYSTERIPSFREVLEWAKGEEMTLLLDLKESGDEYIDRVVTEIHGYGTAENMVIGVRSIDQAYAFRKLLPNTKQLGFIGTTDDIEVFAESGVEVIRLWLRWLEKEPSLADRVRTAGAKLMVNGTVGALEEAKTLMGFLPDWILIDDPAQLNRSLRAINQ